MLYVSPRSVWFAAGVVLLVCACGGSSNQSGQSFRSELEGSWKLARILCDGTESQVLPGTVLDSNVKSWVKHSGHEGTIVWDTGNCVYQGQMKNVDFQSGPKMSIDYSAPSCDGSGCSGFAGCMSQARQNTLPYELTGGELRVTIPLSEFNGQVPCGAGQSTNRVQFLYNKYSVAIPTL